MVRADGVEEQLVSVRQNQTGPETIQPAAPAQPSAYVWELKSSGKGYRLIRLSQGLRNMTNIIGARLSDRLKRGGMGLSFLGLLVHGGCRGLVVAISFGGIHFHSNVMHS